MVSCPSPRPTKYVGDNTWGRIWKQAVKEADLPFHYTPYQVRHTHASWLIDKGVDIEKVRHRLGHGDLTTTTRYVNSQELHQTGEKPQVA
jgi:integrase